MFSPVVSVCETAAVVAEHRPTFWAVAVCILVVDYSLILCATLIVVSHGYLLLN